MSQEEIGVFEAQVSALDHETAQRVTQLVTQCGASLDLAIQAVQDADSTIQKSAYTERNKVHSLLAAFINGA